MSLRGFDLNLLLVFDAVLRERSVLRAAKALALSQPAVSHALNRLRHLLKDALFIRTPTGMLPTPRAEQLALPVRRALNDIQIALETERFVPETAERDFVIAVNNYAAVVAVGPIVAACRAQAPKIRLIVRPSGTLDIVALLDRGVLDLVISARDGPAERFASQQLIADRYVATMRSGHPAMRRTLSLSRLAALQHLSISSSGEDLAFADSALAAHGRSRSVAMEAPYLSAGSVLAQSNLVAILGRKLALEFRKKFSIDLLELPFKADALRSVMLWHRRYDDVPAHKWLRETVTMACAVI